MPSAKQKCIICGKRHAVQGSCENEGSRFELEDMDSVYYRVRDLKTNEEWEETI